VNRHQTFHNHLACQGVILCGRLVFIRWRGLALWLFQHIMVEVGHTNDVASSVASSGRCG